MVEFFGVKVKARAFKLLTPALFLLGGSGATGIGITQFDWLGIQEKDARIAACELNNDQAHERYMGQLQSCTNECRTHVDRLEHDKAEIRADMRSCQERLP